MAIGRLVSVTAAALVALAGTRAQQQDDRYRVTASLVSIYATVVDETGRLVPDLTKSDFVVKDNGRKQPLVVFSNERQPISVVVMLDCSGSMSGELETVRDGAAAFLAKLGPHDRARVGTFASQIRLMPEAFTSDTQQLVELLRADEQPSGGSPIWTAIDRSITALLNQGGRRVVLIFTDGQNNIVRGQVATDLKDIIWRARVDDVMVYAIGFTKDADRSFPALFGRGRFGGLGVPRGNSNSSDAKEARQALQELTGQTGGGYVEMNTIGEVGRAFTRIAEELHRQYWLGIKVTTLDDTMHKLEVSVSRRNVTVQARNSYFAGSFVK